MNDATPANWSIPAYIGEAIASPRDQPDKISQVISYSTVDQNGNSIVVNVTLSDHPLDPGYVVRYVTTDANGQTILNNEGEGTGVLQSSFSPFAGVINNQWISQSQGIINSINANAGSPGGCSTPKCN